MPIRKRKIPQRTCIGCNLQKQEVDPDREDTGRKFGFYWQKSGRGCYICPSVLFEKAFRGNLFEKKQK